MKTKIRRATPHDANVIADHNSLFAQETEHRSLDHKRLLRGVKSLLKDPSKGVYYVAEIGGEVVGQLMITYEKLGMTRTAYEMFEKDFVL